METLEKSVLLFLSKKHDKDKNEYKGDIPTQYNPGYKWSESNWYVDEILNFLNKNTFTSYVLIKFGKENNYCDLDEILKKNFKHEYNKAEYIKSY